MNARKMRILAAGALLALGGLMACNYIGDDNGCEGGIISQTPTRTCRFGPPTDGDNNGGCPNKIPVNKGGADCAGNTWEPLWGEIGPSCAGGTCHDNPAAYAEVYLPLANATDAYNNLAEYRVPCGKNYIDTVDPGSSQIVNNLNGVPRSGSAMPYGGADRKLPPDVIERVQSWVACGAQP